MRRIGGNRNTYTETTGGDVALNTSTYTMLLAESASRIGYKISNQSPHDILVNENGADFVVFKRSVYESPHDDVFIGELTAKSITGSPTVTVAEE